MNTVQQIIDLNTRVEAASKQAVTRLLAEGGWPALAASPAMDMATEVLDKLVEWDKQGRTFEFWKENFLSVNTNKDYFQMEELAPFYDECVLLYTHADMEGYYNDYILPEFKDTTHEQLVQQNEMHHQAILEMAQLPCTPYIVN